MKKIRVITFRRVGRKFYEAQWTDPVSKLKKTRSTGETKKREADRFAGALEKELRDGSHQEAANVTWAEFRHRYETEVLSGKAVKTAQKAFATFAVVERHINPKMLAALDAGQISKLQAKLRDKDKLAEASIKGHMAYLRAALNWACKQLLIPAVPSIDMPTRTAGMMGRPITGEEFERMLDKTSGVVGEDRSESWKFLLHGLWWSGLRIGEAMSFHWSGRQIQPNFSGRYPMLRIAASAQKSRKFQLLPMAPEFAAFLEAVPESERSGFVFNPAGLTQRRIDNASSTICDVGRAANVKVQEKRGKTKYASAHDLRRSFGTRWAQRVMPPVLKELMRHKSIETTMKYYAHIEADQLAARIWKFSEAQPVPDTFTDT